MKNNYDFIGSVFCTVGLALFAGFAYIVKVPAAVLIYIFVSFDWMNSCQKYDSLGVKATAINFIRLLIIMGAAILFRHWWIVLLYFLFSVSVGVKEEEGED